MKGTEVDEFSWGYTGMLFCQFSSAQKYRRGKNRSPGVFSCWKVFWKPAISTFGNLQQAQHLKQTNPCFGNFPGILLLGRPCSDRDVCWIFFSMFGLRKKGDDYLNVSQFLPDVVFLANRKKTPHHVSTGMVTGSL